MRGYLYGVLWLLAGALVVTRAPSAIPSPATNGIPVKGFKVAEPYGPPHETQRKSLLEGGRGLVLPNGSAFLSEGVLLHTYSESNTAQLIVRADECFYDSSNRVIHSAGPIHMQTADGRFAIQGNGFLLQQSNSSLVISNNVHTVIQQALLRSSPTNRNEKTGPTDDGPLLIDSQRFAYDGSSGQGVWAERVQVQSTNLTLHSALLTAVVPMADRQVRALMAERDVDLDYGGIHANGGRLNYAPDTGIIRLTEHASWKAEQREGRGDELVIDQTNHIFQVNHHATLKLGGQAIGNSGLLSATPPSKTGTPEKGALEIACDRYEIRTNWAVFRNQVNLVQKAGTAVRGRLTCDTLTATFTGTNELQTLDAEKHVVIEEGQDKRFTGGRAVYTHTNTTLEITQGPTWRSGARTGKGDLIRVNSQRNEMLVHGGASLHMPAHELAGQLVPTSAGSITNRPPRARGGTNEFADIFCEEYTLGTNASVFLGGVYATHPEMNWSCEKLTALTPVTGMTNLIAEQNVVFEIMTQDGPCHGAGDNAVYSFGSLKTATNGLVPINELKLVGTPAVVAMTERTMQNPVIVWNRANNKVALPGGEYRIQGYAKAINTNIFMLPNKKRTK